MIFSFSSSLSKASDAVAVCLGTLKKPAVAANGIADAILGCAVEFLHRISQCASCLLDVLTFRRKNDWVVSPGRVRQTENLRQTLTSFT